MSVITYMYNLLLCGLQILSWCAELTATFGGLHTHETFQWVG